MEQNLGNQMQENEHHEIKIWEVNKVQLDSMEQKMLAMPQLLSNWAGRSSCTIFRVPQSLIEFNRKAYHPHIVSIGPYHHGKHQLKMIEEHKWRFLHSLISRTQINGLGLEDYMKAIKLLEDDIRGCYSEIINLNTDEFVEMMVLDGCFIIELFRKLGRLVPTDPDDPIFSMSWVFMFLLRDLIRVENQIPFFVLQTLFDLSKTPEEQTTPSLTTLALEFFNNTLQRPDEVIGKYHNLNGKHLLDLLRASFIPPTQEYPVKVNSSTQMIQSVTMLRCAGVRFKSTKADSFLDIKFRHGVLEMPTITIDDFTSSFLLNCIAFEQCHKHCSTHITTYATFLDCLINTHRDVLFLRDANIIENYFGTDGEVARFLNDLGKDVTFDIDLCYLSKLFNDVNEFSRSKRHLQWASFKYTYFNTPWSFMSALAAVILLLLTMAQTYFTIYAYIQPP